MSLPYANDSIKSDQHFRWNNSSKVKVQSFVGHLLSNFAAQASVGKMARLKYNFAVINQPVLIKVKSMQRSGTEAMRTQIQPSKPNGK